MLAQMGAQNLDEALITLFDQRPSLGRGADHMEAADLALGETLALFGDLLVGSRISKPEGQHVRAAFDVGRAHPAVVKHRLGQPLVAVILKQHVDEGGRGIGRDDMAPRMFGFQPSDDRT